MSEPDWLPDGLMEEIEREQPDYCHNCGVLIGRLYDDDDDTYICGVCGDEWDRCPEPPEI
mgnify:CR=1 FL=1